MIDGYGTRPLYVRTTPIGTFLIDRAGGAVTRLQGLSESVWLACQKSLHPKRLAATIADQYEVTFETALTDILEFRSQIQLVGIDPLRQTIDGRGLGLEQSLTSFLADTDLWLEAVEHRIPLSVELELTAKCNLRCAHCLRDRYDLEGLKLIRIRSLLDELAETGTVILVITGGEPLLRDDFCEVVEHAASRGFFISLLTNGTLIDAALARFLKPLVSSVSVSIYGPESVHDGITGVDGSFRRSVEGIKRLKEQGIKTTMSTTLLESNVSSLNCTRTLASELDVPLEVDHKVWPRQNGDAGPIAMRVDPQALDRLLAEGEYEPMRIGYGICTAGTAKAVVTPEGFVHPCNLIRHPRSSLNDLPFRDIWLSDTFGDFVRQIHTIEPAGCAGCEFLSTCDVCPGARYSLHKRFDLLDESLCRVSQRLGRQARDAH